MRTKPLMEPSEYAKTLARKRVGAGALYLNEKEEILLVKPNYRDYWLIPGGSVDKDESPRVACIREIKEETGLELKNPRLLCVRYRASQDDFGDGFLFVFEGGVLGVDTIKTIVLQDDELDGYKFVPLDEALTLVGAGSVPALSAAFKAYKEGTFEYVEFFT
ncbi:MAG: NUDIX hydrolase [Patescibacteria group bacterium]